MTEQENEPKEAPVSSANGGGLSPGWRIVAFFIPYIYRLYMGFVYHTSRKTFIGLDEIWRRLDAGENIMGAIWHQDVVITLYIYRGRQVVTMASLSKDGEIISAILRRLSFIPFRGSSSKYGREALAGMIDYINARRGVFGGFTVDGPRGPARQVKVGMIVLAAETGVPIYPFRTWAKRKILLRTWDQTMLPAPFNHLISITGEPLSVPAGAERETIDSCREELERRLNELAERSEAYFLDPNKSKVEETTDEH